MRVLHTYFFWFAAAIVVLAAVLRLYQIGAVPRGITWDEAAIGYNGYAVLTTRRDEWLHFLPISFRSFGDYKAPFAIYLNGFFTAIFGLNPVGIRMPFVLFGILGVVGMMLLAKEFFYSHPQQKALILLSGILMAFSPWHIHFSRTGFESGMAVMMLLFMLYGLLVLVRSTEKKLLPLLFIAGLAVVSLYTYHSTKVVMPLLAVVFSTLFYTELSLQKHLRNYILTGIASILALTPLILDSIFGDGLTRASVTVFAQSTSFLDTLATLASNVVAHSSLNFLVFGEATTFRHTAGFLGVLYPTTALCMFAFIYKAISKKVTKLERFAIFGIVIGFLPAIIATEAPHPNRALLALPFMLLAATSGAAFCIEKLKNSKRNAQYFGSHGEKDTILNAVVGTTALVHCICVIAFVSYYFTSFNSVATADFFDGYLEAFVVAESLNEQHGFEKIVFTSAYGQPYIYGLLAKKTNPIWYQGGSLSYYHFQDKVGIDDLSRKNTLVIGSGADDLPTQNATHILRGADGTVRFQFFITDK